jgi:hypothetical protein
MTTRNDKNGGCRYWQFLKNPPVRFVLEGWWAVAPLVVIGLIYFNQAYLRTALEKEVIERILISYSVYAGLGAVLGKGYREGLGNEAKCGAGQDTEAKNDS